MLKFEEFKFPMKRSKLAKVLVFDLLGINFIRYFLFGLAAGLREFFESPRKYWLNKIAEPRIHSEIYVLVCCHILVGIFRSYV